MPQAEAAAADNTMSDTKEPAKVVLTFFYQSIQPSVHDASHPSFTFISPFSTGSVKFTAAATAVHSWTIHLSS